MNIWIILTAAVILFLVCGFQYHKMDETHYSLTSEKITKPVRICVLADLHCRRFGEGQSRIIDLVERNHPDMIVIPGDLFDLNRDYEISFELIDRLKGKWMAFSSGNHDIYLSELGELRDRLKEKGVHVLENESVLFNDEIEVIGMTDRGRTLGFDIECYEGLKQSDGFQLLISHRPDYAEAYKKIQCDLIICGHVHGGQWRIPFMKKGMFGPHLTLFPKYTEGFYDLNGRPMFVSRGLASGAPWFFRLYNNPEVSFIDLQPKKDPSDDGSK